MSGHKVGRGGKSSAAGTKSAHTGSKPSGSKPSGSKPSGNPATTPGVQYKWNKQGRFRRVVKEAAVKKPCSGCGMIHSDTKETKFQIEPRDPRFCKFIWKTPPPPSVVTSKNRARISSGKRNGVRKNRKRGTDGLVRQPNDWIIDRLRTVTGNCAHCRASLVMYARKIGNRKNRIVLFNSWENNSVLYSLWFLRLEVWRMYGVAIPSDVVHIIMFHAFSRNIIEDQKLRRDQFHSPCGCKYHVKCYSEYTATKSICAAHKKVFP